MSAKDQVLNTRISANDLEVLKRAADLDGLSTSAFVTRAAVREAEAVIARADRTSIPADLFESIMATLDVPDEAPRLRRAFQNNPAFRGNPA